MRSLYAALILALLAARPALAGPPYVTDDPEPTDFQHYEIYAFAGGTGTADGSGGATGIDFNYGGFRDVQLTVVVPYEFDSARLGPTERGVSNIELAAKYRVLHQDDFGLDVAIFPRVFVQSLSREVGQHHAALLLPIFAEKDFVDWSAFGGGGCTLNHSRVSRNFCQAGAALTRKVLPELTLGLETYYQSADVPGGKSATGLGGGFTYDLTENYHLMASYGQGLQNANTTNRYTWYAALQFTY